MQIQGMTGAHMDKVVVVVLVGKGLVIGMRGKDGGVVMLLMAVSSSKEVS